MELQQEQLTEATWERTELLPENSETIVGQNGDKVMMDIREIDAIKSFLFPDQTVMFEYGSGGSTYYFSQFVKTLNSIEHVPAWGTHVTEEIRRRGITNATVNVAEPDQKVLEEMDLESLPGFGLHHAKPPMWCSPNGWDKWRLAAPGKRAAAMGSKYVNAIGAVGIEKFDVVLVDGRARGECAIAALPYLDDTSVVIIHDWFLEESGKTGPNEDETTAPPRCEAPSYKRVLEFYDVVCTIDPAKLAVTGIAGCAKPPRQGLIVLRKKPVGLALSAGSFCCGAASVVLVAAVASALSGSKSR